MSSRGFLLRAIDDDPFDLTPEFRPISPNIIISRSDYFAARAEGELKSHNEIDSNSPICIFALLIVGIHDVTRVELTALLIYRERE